VVLWQVLGGMSQQALFGVWLNSPLGSLSFFSQVMRINEKRYANKNHRYSNT
jgi:hypothetical protein